jgi:hypothetical protein
MQYSTLPNGEMMLPLNNDDLFVINLGPRRNKNIYINGDGNCNQNPPLLFFHTLWVREHNRLVSKVRSSRHQASRGALDCNSTDITTYTYARTYVRSSKPLILNGIRKKPSKKLVDGLLPSYNRLPSSNTPLLRYVLLPASLSLLVHSFYYVA